MKPRKHQDAKTATTGNPGSMGVSPMSPARTEEHGRDAHATKSGSFFVFGFVCSRLRGSSSASRCCSGMISFVQLQPEEKEMQNEPTAEKIAVTPVWAVV